MCSKRDIICLKRKGVILSVVKLQIDEGRFEMSLEKDLKDQLAGYVIIFDRKNGGVDNSKHLNKKGLWERLKCV